MLCIDIFSILLNIPFIRQPKQMNPCQEHSVDFYCSAGLVSQAQEKAQLADSPGLASL